ncbi:ATP-binding cassette domain-containing protein [Infirmifilum sp. NZ]|uniref:ATP-binding cassette domain-containing protein n=1 Tax=Infirmifilum sp. NZ TaxID=2926850 RepID=UPI00279B38FD|nr:ABC transporter ATP-binding protein [Infirmifilum sp. NZ]UNQ73551.1 ABC transporter ATP-binding protein [Infirmifilum sp. NZ]
MVVLTAETKAVYVEDLVKVYPGGVRALDGVDLVVDEGEVHAVVGPNGAGKTTLMRILTTQIPATSGTALVYGFDVQRDGKRVRSLIGYVPQEFSVWTDVTGYENLLFYAKIYGIPRDRRERVIWDALELMGLSDAAKRLVRTYSGGMIRRLEIAAAMMVRPKILFMDEPTIGLDPRAREIVWEKLRQYRSEYTATVVFNTHYMDEAERFAGRVTVINRGRVIAEGSPRELVKLVGGETVRLRIKGELDKAQQALARLDGVLVLSAKPGELLLSAPDSSTQLPAILKALTLSGVEVESAALSRPSLEDVFIKLTGMSVEEAEKASGIREVASIRKAIRRGG